jgi:hypothetical protein
MGFHGVLWDSMGFYDVPVNRSVPTEANRGLISYMLKKVSAKLHELSPAIQSHNGPRVVL